MKRTIACIIGTSYCGSSLLNLLLDSYHGVRGLGEAANLLRPDAKANCSRCQRLVQHCPLAGHVRQTAFYESIFEFYSDCDVLVDSSKSVAACFGAHRFEPHFIHKVLLLSKSPHEFAHSWTGHHTATVLDAFRLYVDFYAKQLLLLREQSWLRPWDCLRVTYRDLAMRTNTVLAPIADFLGIASQRRAAFWESDTHVVGGNWMIAAQTSSRRELFEPRDQLRGKYSGKYRRVFYDDQWRADESFLEQCLDAYRRCQSRLEPLFEGVGQLDYQQHVSDVRSARVGPTSGAESCPSGCGSRNVS